MLNTTNNNEINKEAWLKLCKVMCRITTCDIHNNKEYQWIILFIDDYSRMILRSVVSDEPINDLLIMRCLIL